MDWIGLAQDRDRWRSLVSAVMNLGVPWNAENFLTGCKPVSCSRRTLHRGASKQVVARSQSLKLSFSEHVNKYEEKYVAFSKHLRFSERDWWTCQFYCVCSLVPPFQNSAPGRWRQKASSIHDIIILWS
jgi:hypothetical protein